MEHIEVRVWSRITNESSKNPQDKEQKASDSVVKKRQQKKTSFQEPLPEKNTEQVSTDKARKSCLYQRYETR